MKPSFEVELSYGIVKQKFRKINDYRIRRCNVPYLSCQTVSLTKSWSLATSLNKIYIENFSIRNYFKKDLLNFSFY